MTATLASFPIVTDTQGLQDLAKDTPSHLATAFLALGDDVYFVGTFDRDEQAAQAVREMKDRGFDGLDVLMTAVIPPQVQGCEVPREKRAERFRAAIAARKNAKVA